MLHSQAVGVSTNAAANIITFRERWLGSDWYLLPSTGDDNHNRQVDIPVCTAQCMPISANTYWLLRFGFSNPYYARLLLVLYTFTFTGILYMHAIHSTTITSIWFCTAVVGAGGRTRQQLHHSILNMTKLLDEIIGLNVSKKIEETSLSPWWLAW